MVLEHPSRIRSMALSADGKRLVTGSYDKTARVFDLGADDPRSSPMMLTGHDGIILGMALTADGKRLATGSVDNTVRIWNLEAEKPGDSVIVFRGHKHWVTALALSADGKRLVSGSRDKTARVWLLETASLLAAGHRVAGRKLSNDERAMYQLGSSLKEQRIGQESTSAVD